MRRRLKAKKMPEQLIPSGSQTIGPYYAFALTTDPGLGVMAHPGAKGERISLIVRVSDGEGLGVSDAMIELWQADANGNYRHPGDPQNGAHDPAFTGFGRLGTDPNGACTFETVKPGRVAGPDGKQQAPHIVVTVFARGMLLHTFTRIYFAGDPANDQDAVLAHVPADRRATLVAHPDSAQPGIWRWDIHLCGDKETVFFDL